MHAYASRRAVLGGPATLAILAIASVAVWPLGSRLAWADLWSATALLAVFGLCCLRWTLQRAQIPIATPFIAAASLCLLVGVQIATAQSVHPAGSLEGLISISSLLALAVMAQLVTSPGQRRIALISIVATGLAVSIFALVQHVTWNERLFWFYDPPMGGTFPFGPFNNRNYYAGYMIAALGPGIGLTLAPGALRLRLATAVVFGFGAFTVLVSLSRGGILALALATAVTLGVYALFGGDRTAASSRRMAIGVMGSLVFAAGIAAALAATGQLDAVTSRLATFANLTDDTSVGGRLVIWQDTLRMIADRPVLGTGLNTFVWGHLPYRSLPTGIPQHAHNEYLEVVAETGLIGGAICLAFLVLLWRTMIREYRRAQTGFEIGLRLGAMASWLGIMIYALTDFPTVIPATNYVLALLAGLACVPAAEAEGRAAVFPDPAAAGQRPHAETPADP